MMTKYLDLGVQESDMDVPTFDLTQPYYRTHQGSHISIPDIDEHLCFRVFTLDLNTRQWLPRKTCMLTETSSLAGSVDNFIFVYFPLHTKFCIFDVALKAWDNYGVIYVAMPPGWDKPRVVCTLGVDSYLMVSDSADGLCMAELHREGVVKPLTTMYPYEALYEAVRVENKVYCIVQDAIEECHAACYDIQTQTWTTICRAFGITTRDGVVYVCDLRSVNTEDSIKKLYVTCRILVDGTVEKLQSGTLYGAFEDMPPFCHGDAVTVMMKGWCRVGVLSCFSFVPQPKPYQKELVGNTMLSDIRFVVQGEALPAHRVMLLRSEFFSTMFSDRWKSTDMPSDILIDDASMAAVKLMLEFLYVGEVSFDPTAVTLSHLAEVLMLSNKFIIPELQLVTEQAYAKRLATQATVKELLTALALSFRINKKGVLRYVAQHFTLLKLPEVMACDSWKDFIKQEDEIVTVLMLALAEEAKDNMKMKASNTYLQFLTE
eukprot:PhF_6_TR17014/c0_g1_i3/m.25787